MVQPGLSWEFPEDCVDQPSERNWRLIGQIVTIPQVQPSRPHAGDSF